MAVSVFWDPSYVAQPMQYMYGNLTLVLPWITMLNVVTAGCGLEARYTDWFTPYGELLSTQLSCH
jgi:hypothetical protein